MEEVRLSIKESCLNDAMESLRLALDPPVSYREDQLIMANNAIEAMKRLIHLAIAAINAGYCE